MMDDLKTTKEQRDRLRTYLSQSAGLCVTADDGLALLDDIDTLKGENAELRSQIERSSNHAVGALASSDYTLGTVVAERDALRAQVQKMREAIQRQVHNIERWLKSGVPADAKESKEIYEQLVNALAPQPTAQEQEKSHE